MKPTIKLGQPYSFIPTSGAGSIARTREDERRRLTGRVVYVHPKGRWFLVEAALPRGKIRECFLMTGGSDDDEI